MEDKEEWGRWQSDGKEGEQLSQEEESLPELEAISSDALTRAADKERRIQKGIAEILHDCERGASSAAARIEAGFPPRPSFDITLPPLLTSPVILQLIPAIGEPKGVEMSTAGTAQSGPKPLLQAQPSSQRLPTQATQQQQQQQSGLRVPSNRKTIYDRNLNRTRTAELSRASFGYLFAEMVSYAQRRVTGIQDLERRLNEAGYPLGLRLLPLLLLRSSTPTAPAPRPTRILPLLTFLSQTLWRHLFQKPADAIEQSSTQSSEYMITDNEPLVNGYISVPKEMSQLNCAAFVAGIIEGVCGGCGMKATVSAHNAGDQPEGGMWVGRTVFLIRFEEEVVRREGGK